MPHNAKEESMKNYVLTLGLGLLTVTGVAQTATDAQLPNSNFKNFESDATNSVGVRPVGWKASNVNQMLKKQLIFDASAKGEGVQMKNDFVGMFGMGANAPAYITLGQTWNYVKGMDASTGDGGTYGGIDFGYMPDAVSISYKRVMGKEKPSEDAKVIIYAWKGQTSATSAKWSNEMIDREQDILGMTAADVQVTKSADFALISHTDYTIKAGTMSAFETVDIPMTYVSNEKPTKLNVILSSADYYTRANIGKGNELYVNHIQLAYYHELTSVIYDGTTYAVTQGEVVDLSTIKYDAAKISFEKKGVGANILTSYDEEAALLTVKVLGSDNEVNPESATAYTVQFAKDVAPTNNAIASVTIGGEDFADFKSEQTAYTLPYAYHPGIVFEGVAAEGFEMVADGQSAAFYDNAAQTVTLKAKDAAEHEVNYVFNFTNVVEGEQAGDYKGGLLVVLTNAEGADSKAPLMSNEVLQITHNQNGTVNLAINNFSFSGLMVGDIFVSNVPLVDNKINVKKLVRLTSYQADGKPTNGALGWMFGALPLQVEVTLHPETGGKYAEASIDILTSETMLAGMFKNIHVDIVPFEFEASEPISAEGPWGSVSYYSFIKATGYMTKASAKFLQLTNSYVNEEGKQIDRPMNYIDLTQVKMSRDVTLDDIMTGAPTVNNTLVYVNATSTISGQNVVKGDIADRVVLSDLATFFAPKAFTAQQLSYNRKFTAETAEGLVLPFDVPAAAIQGKLYQFDAVAQGEVNFKQVETDLLANQPYLVEAADAQLFGDLENVEFVVTPATAADMKVSVGAYHHFGTYNDLSVQSKDNKTFYELKDGKFVKADQATVVPFRTMLASDAATALEQLNLKFEQIETGLESIEVASASVDVYSLDGKLLRRQVKVDEAVQGLPSGLYIVGGKKTIVK